MSLKGPDPSRTRSRLNHHLLIDGHTPMGQRTRDHCAAALCCEDTIHPQPRPTTISRVGHLMDHHSQGIAQLGKALASGGSHREDRCTLQKCSLYLIRDLQGG